MRPHSRLALGVVTPWFLVFFTAMNGCASGSDCRGPECASLDMDSGINRDAHVANDNRFDAGPDGGHAEEEDGSATEAERDSGGNRDAQVADGGRDGGAHDSGWDAGIALCPAGGLVLGRYASWCGKVNVHTSTVDGTWVADPDCASGCGVDPLSYCSRFFPDTLTVEETSVTPVPKPFQTARCSTLEEAFGHDEYLCCGPVP